MFIDMLHKIFRNKIYQKIKCKIIIICFIHQAIWMFITCYNDNMYCLLVINE